MGRSLLLIYFLVLGLSATPDIWAQSDVQRQWYRYPFPDELYDYQLTNIGQDDLGYIWVYGEDRAFFLGNEEFINSAEKPQFPGRNAAPPLPSYASIERPIDSVFDGSVHWVLGGDLKLYKVDDSVTLIPYPVLDQSSYESNLGLGPNSKLMLDRDQRIWMLGENGVLLFSDEAPLFYFRSLDFNTSRVTSIYRDQINQRIYLLSTNYGVFITDMDFNLLEHHPASEEGLDINAFRMIHGPEYSYIYAQLGLFQLERRNGRVTNLINAKLINGTEHPRQLLNAIEFSADSALVYVGTKHNNFYSYDLETSEIKEFALLPAPERNNLIYEMHFLSDGQGIILGALDVFHFDPVSGQVRSTSEQWPGLKFKRNVVPSDFEIIHDSLLVFATLGQGMYIYNIARDSMYQPVTQNAGKLNISDLFPDQQDGIWGSATTGILRYDYQNNTLRLFNSKDGLPGEFFHYRYMSNDEDGTMYLGLASRFMRFDPTRFEFSSQSPMYIQSLIVNNTEEVSHISRDHSRPIYLNYDQNNWKISLGGPSYGQAKSTGFGARLLGLDNNWIANPENDYLSFSALRPGNYTLEFRSFDRMDEIFSRDIKIRPPVWKQTWFRLLMLLLLLSAAAFLYFNRIRYVRREAELKMQFEKQLSQMELKALRAQMNPHFLFNSLNSVKSLISRHENEKAVTYLTRFSQLIRQVLNNSRNKFVRLQDEINALQIYLDLEKMRFQNFDYQIDIDPALNPDFLEIPPMIIQPYVENAIWHGLRHKEDGEGVIRISAARSDGMVNLTISDNGIGRKRSQDLKTRSRSKKESLGMRITEDRLAFLKDIYGQEARVEVHDLTNPTGTRVEIWLPIPD